MKKKKKNEKKEKKGEKLCFLGSIGKTIPKS